MTTPEDANQGLYPTKGLNFQILNQFESILEKYPELDAELRKRYDGRIIVSDSQHTPGIALNVERHGPKVRKNGDSICIYIPDEWYAFVYLLTTAAYFSIYDPLERANAANSRDVEVSDNARLIINGALNEVRAFVTTGFLKWPDILPPHIDETNPSTAEWHKINSIYITAILFIMLHEGSHIINDDLELSQSIPPDHSKEVETRCDSQAAEWLLGFYNGSMNITTQVGIVVALGAVVAFTKNAPSQSHPEPVMRASNAFHNLGIEMSSTAEYMNDVIFLWVAKIAGAPDETLNQLISGGLNIDQVHDNLVTILRQMD